MNVCGAARVQHSNHACGISVPIATTITYGKAGSLTSLGQIFHLFACCFLLCIAAS